MNCCSLEEHSNGTLPTGRGGALQRTSDGLSTLAGEVASPKRHHSVARDVWARGHKRNPSPYTVRVDPSTGPDDGAMRCTVGSGVYS